MIASSVNLVIGRCLPVHCKDPSVSASVEILGNLILFVGEFIFVVKESDSPWSTLKSIFKGVTRRYWRKSSRTLHTYARVESETI